MLRSLLATVVLGTSLVNASVINRQAAAVGFTDTYDALVTGSEVNLLHALEYTGAKVAVHHLPDGTESMPIVPKSKPKYAVATQILSHFSNGGVSGDSYININAASNVSSFDLYGLSFACTTFDGKAFQSAQPCTLALYGIGDGVRKYSATFEYTPSSTDNAPMASAGFNYPNFRQIQNLSIGIVKGSAPVGKTALVIDSLDHINYASG